MFGSRGQGWLRMIWFICVAHLIHHDQISNRWFLRKLWQLFWNDCLFFKLCELVGWLSSFRMLLLYTESAWLVQASCLVERQLVVFNNIIRDLWNLHGEDVSSCHFINRDRSFFLHNRDRHFFRQNLIFFNLLV